MLLDWIAPPECPSEHAVVSQVTTLVGESLVAQPLVVRARVADGTTRRFRLDLRIGANEESSRTLESDDCGELAQATALIVSFDLQSRAKAAKSEEHATPDGGAPPSAEGPAPERPPSGENASAPRALAEAPAGTAAPVSGRGSETASPRTTGFGLGADFFADAGSLPAGAWGSGVMAFVTEGRFRGELGAALWPRTRALSSIQPGAGASLYLRTIGLRACLVAVPSLHIDTCLHLEGGSARTTGFGISRPTTSNGRWLATFLGATARPFAWGDLAPRFTVELGAPLHYATAAIVGLGDVYTPSPILFRVGVGLESKLF